MLAHTALDKIGVFLIAEHKHPQSHKLQQTTNAGFGFGGRQTTIALPIRVFFRTTPILVL